MIKIFRLIALVEGVSTVLLFLVAMPLKYFAGWPHLVPPVGMTHGILWIVYTAAIPICLIGRGFSILDMIRAFLAGLIPLGTFLNDGAIKRVAMRRQAAV